MRIRLQTESTVVLHNAVATLPVPSSLTDGQAVGWRGPDGSGFYSLAELEITADKATELAVTNGALALYRVAAGRLSFVALLNNGSPITIQKNGAGPVVGFTQPIQLPTVADRLIVGGYGGTCTPTNGALVTVRITPILGE